MTENGEVFIKEIKENIKENIKELIHKQNLIKAKEILKEYEKIVDYDIDIYSMKSVIAMLEGNFDCAEQVLRTGLQNDINNVDLLYNLGFLYEQKGEHIMALNFYNRALEKVQENELKEEIEESIKDILINLNKGEDLIKRKTSIIILTYNNLEYTKMCIQSIRKYTKKDSYEIIIVDNNSTDGTVEWLKEQKDLKIIFNNENLGFPKGCNQGINIADPDNDILLLNNDTIVTPSWLENLKCSLYSRDDIGAVGAVTNSCSNYQAVLVKYNNIDEMINYAIKNNICDPKKWEERLRLVGFCMLIKNEVVKKVGLLDEIFTPGNFEDDDYSLRIRQAGYRLLLCKDTFIHHFGSASFRKEAEKYGSLLMKNRQKFMNKWKLDPYYIADIRKDITQFIMKKSNSEYIKVLHIGCGGGGTLLDIKNQIPTSELYGIESIKQAVVNLSHVADIKIGKLDKIEEFNKCYFDFIFLTQPQENYKDILTILNYIKDYVKNHGQILIPISKNKTHQNDKFIENVRRIMGEFYFEIIEMNKDNFLYIKKTIQKKELVKNNSIELTVLNKQKLNEILNKDIKDIKNEKFIITSLIRRIDNNLDFDENVEKLTRFLIKKQLKEEILKHIVFNHGVNKVKLFNVLGNIYYQLGKPEKSLMFFHEAFKLDKENGDTIYNIAFILYQLKQNEVALKFLNQVKILDDDLELIKLKHQIEGVI